MNTAAENEWIARRLAESAAQTWGTAPAPVVEDGTVYRVPARFYDDHTMRDGAGGTVVKRSARMVSVRMTDDAAADLAKDARFYAAMGRREFDRELSGLVSSAEATVRALARQGVAA